MVDLLSLCPGIVCDQCGVCTVCCQQFSVHLPVCACVDPSVHYVCMKCVESNGD